MQGREGHGMPIISEVHKASMPMGSLYYLNNQWFMSFLHELGQAKTSLMVPQSQIGHKFAHKSSAFKLGRHGTGAKRHF